MPIPLTRTKQSEPLVISIGLSLFAISESATVAVGRALIPPLPSTFAGKKLIRAQISADVSPAGSGSTVVQIHNLTTGLDMLTTGPTLTPGSLIGTVGVPNVPNSSTNTDDRLRIDVSQVATPAPSGVSLTMEFK